MATTTPSFYLWDHSRSDLDRAAFHLARWMDPEFFWVEVQDPVERTPWQGMWLEGAVGRRRFTLVQRPDEFIPTTERRNSTAFWTYMRAGASNETADEVVELLQLPSVLRQLSSRPGSSSGHRALVIANVDRLEAVRSEVARSFESTIRACAQAGVTLVVTHHGTPKPSREQFDYELGIPPGGFAPGAPPIPICVRRNVEGCAVLRSFPREVVRCRAELAPMGAMSSGYCLPEGAWLSLQRA